MERYREVELIDIGIRNRDIGTLAMKSYIGSRSFCKAVVLSSLISCKQADERMRLDMRLHFEVIEYIEEAIADQLRTDDRRLTEAEVETIRSTVYREIHQCAKWLRNKTGGYVDRVQEVNQIRVAPDFVRGVLVVRFAPL